MEKKKSKHGKNSQMSSSTPNPSDSQQRVEYRQKHSRKNREYSGSNQHYFTASAPDLGFGNRQVETADEELSVNSQADVVINHQNVQRKNREYSGSNQHNFTALAPDLCFGNQQVETADEELSANSQADVVINPSNHQNIQAGILADQLSLALEPEAASLYCRKVPMSIKESELKTLTLLGSGKSYVVLDQGGGTLDVTGHQIEEDNFLKEIFPPNGGNWGRNNVNYEFERYLEELFTIEVVHKVKREDPVAYFETVKQFERKKKSFKPKSDADVIFNVSQAFTDVYKKIHKSDLPSEIRIKHGKIRISALRFKEFFNQSIQSITRHLSEIFKSPKLQNVDIILAVGGFSESEIIIDSIREHFPNMQIVVPKDPGLAVLKGAVLFGLEPLSVKSRISRYTYGIKIEKEISTEEDERYRTLRKNRQSIKFATDVFEKLVEIGEEIKVGEWQPATEYDPISKDDQEVKIEFYATEEKDPVHVTDPGCMKLGTLNVDLKERTSSNGALKLEINAGGTEIKAVITDENTGKKFKAKFCLP